MADDSSNLAESLEAELNQLSEAESGKAVSSAPGSGPPRRRCSGPARDAGHAGFPCAPRTRPARTACPASRASAAARATPAARTGTCSRAAGAISSRRGSSWASSVACAAQALKGRNILAQAEQPLRGLGTARPGYARPGRCEDPIMRGPVIRPANADERVML